MQKRKLGKTDYMLSLAGFGGIVVTDETPEDAARYVREAIDRGINYFDVAPTYGNAEERLGPAIEPYRDNVFLACKTIHRDRDAAAAGLRKSLETLRTDHVDLYQLHGVTEMSEVDAITGPGGALEAFREAREEGRTHLIGFSAHSEEAALALMERFDFDTILFPVNYVTWYAGGFAPAVLKEAEARGMGILALKALARTAWQEGEKRTWPKCWYKPVLDEREALLAARWTLSRPVTAAVSASHAELLWWLADAAEKFTPVTAAEEAEIAAKARGIEPIFKAPSARES